MTDSYVLEYGSDRIQVRGSMKEDGEVKVTVNGEVHQYNTSNGSLDRTPTSAEFRGEDGSYIEESPTSQEIRLPDGTVIKKKPVSTQAVLPDGSEISTEDSQAEKLIRVNTSDNSINISVQSETKVSTSSTDEDDRVENERYSRTDFVTDIIPGFWTSLFLAHGVISASEGAFLLGVIMYCTYFIPSLVKFVGYQWAQRKEDTEKDEDSTEDEIEQAKSSYLEGDITEEEFEERVEEVLEPESKEIEYSYN